MALQERTGAVAQIEETQEALRRSIAQSELLTKNACRLLERHRAGESRGKTR